MSDSTGGWAPPPPPPPSAGGGGPIPQRRIGQILTTAVEVYRANAAKLITITALVVVPLALVDALLTKVVWAPRKETVLTVLGPRTISVSRGLFVVLLASVIGLLLAFVMSFVVQAAVSRAAAQATIGDPVDTQSSFRWGFRHVGSVIAIALLAGLCILAGLVLFIIPGIFVAVMLSVVIPVFVFEGKRGGEALSRSWNLARGHFWHVLGTILSAGVIASVATGILTAIGGRNWLAYFVFSAIGRVITVPFTALVSVLLYLDLRARGESLTGQTLRSEIASGA